MSLTLKDRVKFAAMEAYVGILFCIMALYAVTMKTYQKMMHEDMR